MATKNSIKMTPNIDKIIDRFSKINSKYKENSDHKIN